MKKILYIAISIFIVFILIFVLLSYISPVKHRMSSSKNKNETPLSTLFFVPDSLYTTCNREHYDIPIYLSTDQNSISGIQIELSYNPEFIYNTSLSPSSENLFGKKSYEVTLAETRENLGRASLALSLNEDKNEISGRGKVAVFSFDVSSFTNQTLKVNFLEKSTALSRGVEVSELSSTMPLTIYCSKTNLPSIQPTLSPGS